ncbi:hypothetical protein AAMO2058_001146900 [Amorphochlora amoebiformis]
MSQHLRIPPPPPPRRRVERKTHKRSPSAHLPHRARGNGVSAPMLGTDSKDEKTVFRMRATSSGNLQGGKRVGGSALQLRVKETLLSELKAARVAGVKRRTTFNDVSKKLFDSIKKGDLLGEGAYGKVYRAKVVVSVGKLKKGDIVALKEQRGSEESKRENEISRLFQGCTSIVQTYEVFTYQKRSFTVMELMQSDLTEYTTKKEDMLDVAQQIASALNFIHNKGIVHRDLKLENVFMKFMGYGNKRRLVAKIGDFGLSLTALEASGKAAHPLGICPEMMIASTYPYKSDVFAVGMMLLQMVCYAAEEDGNEKLWMDIAKLYLLLNTKNKIESFRICLDEMANEILDYFIPDSVGRKKREEFKSRITRIQELERGTVFAKVVDLLLKKSQTVKKLSLYIKGMLEYEPVRRKMPAKYYREPVVIPVVVRKGKHRRGLSITKEKKLQHRKGSSNILNKLEAFYHMSISDKKYNLKKE